MRTILVLMSILIVVPAFAGGTKSDCLVAAKNYQNAKKVFDDNEQAGLPLLLCLARKGDDRAQETVGNYYVTNYNESFDFSALVDGYAWLSIAKAAQAGSRGPATLDNILKSHNRVVRAAVVSGAHRLAQLSKTVVAGQHRYNAKREVKFKLVATGWKAGHYTNQPRLNGQSSAPEDFSRIPKKDRLFYRGRRTHKEKSEKKETPKTTGQ